MARQSQLQKITTGAKLPKKPNAPNPAPNPAPKLAAKKTEEKKPAPKKKK